jgi:hypothetical protein
MAISEELTEAKAPQPASQIVAKLLAAGYAPVIVLTQAEYDALTPDPSIVYLTTA